MITKVKAKYVVGYDGSDHVVLLDGEVVYENETILYVGKSYEGAVDETIDAGNAVVCPGFIDLNALGDIDHDIIHLEAYPEVIKSLRPSEEYFRKGPHELMSAEDEAFKSLYAYTQLIMSGVTTAMPITSTYYKGWAETYEEAVAAVQNAARVGLRLYTSPSYQCGLGVSKGDGSYGVCYDEQKGKEGLECAIEFVKKFDGMYNGLIRGCLEPERIETQTEQVLLETKDAAERLNCPIKLHAAQGKVEYDLIHERTGKSSIGYLNDIHFLSKRVGIPHCHITAGTRWGRDEDGDDLTLLQETGTTVIHCPVIIGRSGGYLDSFAKYRRRGINVVLGTDTFPPDFFQNIRTASMFSRMVEGNAVGSTYADIYRAATLGAAQYLGRDDLGRLCKGAKADMIVVDLDSLHMGPIDDPIRTMFMAGNRTDIKMSIINGRIVMKDQKVLGVDTDELKERGQIYYDKMKLGYMERDGFHLPAEEIFRPSYRTW